VVEYVGRNASQQIESRIYFLRRFKRAADIGMVSMDQRIAYFPYLLDGHIRDIDSILSEYGYCFVNTHLIATVWRSLRATVCWATSPHPRRWT
jgi:hypothetical protein